ncbi:MULTISPECIES: hypothetical protein [unclassified Spirosoma]|uniref:hypothetical protein n=1 Tax=unclassified Spirosoma TaxID=2621999 RepID=UPI00095E5095|nr:MULTISPECIES: hypothetical protein [unclassified Spirosoma]MBN8824469.1 hypothetical protein [Spirosoma sp.]OJW70067.1 MAG: hypothetical protein BGO59_25675 [Spirosoma sp. 48-14]
MNVKIIAASTRLAWYSYANQIGNVFEVEPFTGVYGSMGDMRVTTGEWAGYIIAGSDAVEVLTRQQAIEQGYEYCGLAGEGWQTLRDITDLEDDEFDQYKWLLFDKDSDCLKISSDVVKDSVLDLVCEAENEIGCDTSMGIDALKDFDWQQLFAVIDNVNKALSTARYYTLTKIQLVP